MAFALQVVTARYYGTRSELDAFLNASTIPVVLFGIFDGAIVAALVPTFTGYVSQDRMDDVRSVGSTIINSLLVAFTVLTVLGWFLAPLLVPILARGFPRPEQMLEVRMLRWLMPGIIATSLSSVCSALLNANRRFLPSAMIMVAANLVTIAAVDLLHRQLGIFALVLGSVFGLFAQLLVQIPSILRDNLYRFELNLGHAGLRKAWKLLVPVALGSGAAQINVAFDRYFASTLPSGSTAAMGYTWKLAYMPLIAAGAVGTVLFPIIAAHFASSNHQGIRRSLSLALGMVSFVAVPSAFGLAILAHPIVQTLFERGAFDAAATTYCSSLVPFACLSLIASSYTAVLARACYACQEVRWPLASALAVVVVNVALSATLLPTLGARGLLLSNGIASIIGTLFLIAPLRKLIGGFESSSISSFFRIVISSLAMAAVDYGIASVGFIPASTLTSRIWHLTSLLAVSAIVYVSMTRVLGVEELKIVGNGLMRRFRRGTRGPLKIRLEPPA